MRRSAPVAVAVAALTGCILDPPPVTPPQTLFSDVEFVVVGTAEDGLKGPRDLDFNPDVPGEMWVLNREDDATVTYSHVGTEAQTALYRKDPYALHFMEESAAISFARGMKFGTCGESRNTYDDQVPGNDFMGPALWSADPDIYAKSNPEAIADNDGFDLGSHLDMMHETPLCQGIAWVSDNIYFTFEGLTGTIARYDFKTDHGPGFDFHGDGTVERFVDVDVVMVEDVPSHMVHDEETGLLYVADSGNGRVMVLDASTAIQMREFPGFETMVQESEGAGFTEFADGDDGLVVPSGIALKDGVLYVADNATAVVTAFDLDGNVIETLDFGEFGVEEGGLMGIRVSPDGSALFAVDFGGDRVVAARGLGAIE